jgi:hypothetical protein
MRPGKLEKNENIKRCSVIENTCCIEGIKQNEEIDPFHEVIARVKVHPETPKN